MTEDQVESIIHNWSSMQDLWQGDESWIGETVDKAYTYPPSSLIAKPGQQFRELPEHYAEQAREYISVVCRRYPLQVRVLLGLPMWLRFCQAWHETGDRRKAMRVI